MKIINDKYTLRVDSFNTRGKNVKVSIVGNKITIRNVKSVAVGWVVPKYSSLEPEYLILINPHEDDLIVEHMKIGVGISIKDVRTNKWKVLPTERSCTFKFRPDLPLRKPFSGWNNIVIGDNTELEILEMHQTIKYNTIQSENLSLNIGDHATCLVNPLNVYFKKLDIHLQPYSKFSSTKDSVPVEAFEINIKAEQYSSLSSCKVITSVEIVYHKLGSELKISHPENIRNYKILATNEEEKAGKIVITKFPVSFIPGTEIVWSTRPYIPRPSRSPPSDTPNR